MKYSYWGFGLKISSEIKFPELLPHEYTTAPDVVIKIGEVPAKISGNTITDTVLTYTINDYELLLESEDVAKYYSKKGEGIVIEPKTPVDDWRGVRLHVLASMMASVLQYKQRLPLHASALLKNN